MVYWLSLDVVEQRAEEEKRETAAGGRSSEKGREMAAGETERMNGKEREKGRCEKERRSETGDYRPRRRLVYGSADAHHLLKKTCCSKCVHFACTDRCAQTSWHNEITDRISLCFYTSVRWSVGHRSLIFRQMPIEDRGGNSRRLTCRHGYSGTTNFVSSYTPIARR